MPQRVAQPSSGSQGCGAQESQVCPGLLTTLEPLPASFFLSVRDVRKPVLPKSPSGWDGDSDVSKVCLTMSKGL